jgi:hypothetical protein
MNARLPHQTCYSFAGYPNAFLLQHGVNARAAIQFPTVLVGLTDFFQQDLVFLLALAR